MENDILNSGFFDKEIFLVPEVKNVLNGLSGSNQKNILVVYNKTKASAENLELLKKILLAVKLDMAQDVLCYGLEEGKKGQFIALQTKELIKEALIFGIKAADLGLNFHYQAYMPVSCNDCRFLFVDDLADIAADKNLKGKLWQCLQDMYL